VEDAADAARHNISHGLRQATDTTNDLTGRAADTVKKYPIRTVVIVAIAAAVTGFMFGASRRR
jgi:hypothetical protein